MKALRDIRVLPVVLVAICGLTVLKVAGLAIDGGYVFDYQAEPVPRSWAEENLNFPSRHKAADQADVTGSVEEKPKEMEKAAEKPADKEGKSGDKDKNKEEAAKPSAGAPESKPDGVVIYPEQGRPVSASERAILERLQSRREELEARAREIDIRESLLKASEKRVDSKVEELKSVEAKVSSANEQKSDTDAAKLKGLVTMYEGMKPKDAARVFDRLEMSVLFELATQIAPRKMSDILGLMSPEAAERLTVEMAKRAGGGPAGATAELPKIEGKVMAPKGN